MKYNEPDKIELRSEEVQEILGTPPKWMIRYGITLIFCIVGGLFIGSYFFKYPDILPATITVTTENLPADIIAKTSGKIDSLHVYDKQKVKQGDVLAVIENPANFQDVLLLMQSLKNFQIKDSLFYPVVNGVLQLGDIQQTYFSFLRAYEDYRFFYDNRHYQKKIALLKKQIATQEKILAKTRIQVSLSAQQLKSARQLFAIDSALFNKDVISLSDFESSKSTYFQQEQSYEATKMTLDNQQIELFPLFNLRLQLFVCARKRKEKIILLFSFLLFQF